MSNSTFSWPALPVETEKVKPVRAALRATRQIKADPATVTAEKEIVVQPFQNRGWAVEEGDDLLAELLKKNRYLHLTMAIAHRLSGVTRYDMYREMAAQKGGAA